jgi:hypothetical protein
MRITTTPSRQLTLVALVLLLGALLAPRLGAAPAPGSSAQQALSITVPRFLVFGTGSPAGRVVDYLPSVELSDPAADLECDPPPGFFERGGHTVTCTATAGAASASATFYVLVAFDDDTDVSVDSVRQVDEAGRAVENPLRPAALVEYQVEVRNNGLLTARQPIVTATIPESIELRLPPGGRCKLGAARLLTCTLLPIAGGKATIVQIPAQVRQGFLGSFTFRAAVSLGDGQRDLEASLNSGSRTTIVQDPGFGENALFIPLVRK